MPIPEAMPEQELREAAENVFHSPSNCLRALSSSAMQRGNRASRDSPTLTTDRQVGSGLSFGTVSEIGSIKLAPSARDGRYTNMGGSLNGAFLIRSQGHNNSIKQIVRNWN